jgi:UDP-N-acetylglucosamine acyltransferase
VISPQAIIDPLAHVADNVEIGPWTYIGPDVEIGEGTIIGPHVIIKGPTKIGRENRFFQFSSIGEDAQDKKYKDEKTFLEIGDRNVFREFVTINRGVMQAGGITKIGNDNLFMAYVHIAHDCIIGNNTVFANHSTLAGHVTVGDFAILSGVAGVNQFCQIGPHSFIGAGTKVTKDVLPYVLVDGREAEACGLNLVGLKRRGYSSETINHLRRAYKIIYRSDLTVAQAIEQLNTMLAECPEVKLMIDALQNSTRGIVR